jgi:hypothetical protein
MTVAASDYIIVQKENRTDFTDFIKSKLLEGWVLFGSPSFLYDGINFQYIQAMVLEVAP